MTALAALRKTPSKPSLKPKNSQSARKRLNFATFITYPACHGYEYPASPEEVTTILDAGYSCPQVVHQSKSVILPESLSRINTDLVIQFGSMTSPRAAMEFSNNNEPTLTGHQVPLSSPVLNDPTHDEDFSRMIEETADRFWCCDRCLSLSHDTLMCTGKIRCKGCYRYGHV
jgi:hypothetical protein